MAGAITSEHTAGTIREHVREVLASATFASSARLREFLQFVVERTLDGDGDALKEYTIATEVYGRDVTYDPQIDSLVRVEASRLRRKLREYYEGEGKASAFELRLPKGRYVPAFEHRPATTPTAPTQPPVRRWYAVAALASAVLCGALLWTVAPASIEAKSHESAHAAVLPKFLRAQQLLRANVMQQGWPRGVPPNVQESIRLFEEVTAEDSAFARAWVGLAEAEEWAYELNGNQPAARLDRATAALNRAVMLEPQMGEAWARLSSLQFHAQGNWRAAEISARKAVELNPHDVLVTVRFIDLLRIAGKHEEAERVVSRALLLEPAAPKLWIARAMVSFDQSRYEEADGYANHALGLFAGKSHPMGWWMRGMCLERLGRLKEAEEQYRRGMASAPVEGWNPAALGYMLARSGRTREAEQMLAKLHEERAQGMVRCYQIALVLTGLGRVNEAVEWLERGRAEGDSSMPYIGLEKRFERLRDQERFRALAD